MNEKIGEARREYLLARRAYEEYDQKMKRQLAALRSDRDRAERELVEAMMESDPPVTNWTDGDGLRFQFAQKFGISVTRENTQAVRDWLVETKGDDMPFVEEKVNKAAVSRLVKKICEEEGSDVVPEFLNLYRGVGISVTGWNEYVTLKRGNDD